MAPIRKPPARKPPAQPPAATKPPARKPQAKPQARKRSTAAAKPQVKPARKPPAVAKPPAREPLPEPLPRRPVGAVETAVKRDLKALGKDLASSGLAAIALAMSKAIDAGEGSPSQCGKVLIEALEDLRALKPPEEKRDKLDEIKLRREQRLASRGAAPAHLPCP